MLNNTHGNCTAGNCSAVKHAYNEHVTRATSPQPVAHAGASTGDAEPACPSDHQVDSSPGAYDDSRLTAMGLLAETVAGLANRTAVQLADHHLSQAEFEVLLRIARTPGGALRMSDLAAQTMLTTSGITRVVDRLEHDGLIERRACPTDRRGSFACITPAGTDRLDETLPGHLEILQTWLTGRLTPEQLTTTLASLRIIRDGVRPDATAGATDSGTGTGTGPSDNTATRPNAATVTR